MTFTLPPRTPNGYTLLDICSKAGGAGYGYTEWIGGQLADHLARVGVAA